MDTREPKIQVNLSDSIYWNGKGVTIVSGTLNGLANILKAAVNPQNTIPEGLCEWFRHDTWTQEQGLILLLGLDPKETSIEPSIWLGMNNERVDEIMQAKFLDGREIDFAKWFAVFNQLKSKGIQGIDDNLAKKVKDEIFVLSQIYRDMKTIFESGNHPIRNRPDFYVQWALGKGFNVPWLDWYEHRGVSSKSDKDLNPIEPIVKGLTKRQIARAFEDVYWSYDRWIKYLGSSPKWLKSCRVAIGSRAKQVSHTWNPVLIGIALIGRTPPDKSLKINSLGVRVITVNQLDSVFSKLKDWEKDWIEKTEIER